MRRSDAEGGETGGDLASQLPGQRVEAARFGDIFPLLIATHRILVSEFGMQSVEPLGIQGGTSALTLVAIIGSIDTDGDL